MIIKFRSLGGLEGLGSLDWSDKVGKDAMMYVDEESDPSTSLWINSTMMLWKAEAGIKIIRQCDDGAIW